MPTLAELRARKTQPLPKMSETVTLVEGQHLLEESRRLVEELAEINRRVRTHDDDEPTGPPLKSSAKVPDRAEEIEARANAIRSELADHQGDVDVVGMSGGDWQRWKDEHPAREGHSDDEQYAFGICDFSALFADLGRFVTAWDGEALDEGAWDSWLAERICYADRRDLVSAVVRMQETKLPKASAISSPSLTDESD